MLVAGYNLIGVCHEAVELFFVPDKVCVFHCAGKPVVRQRACLSSDSLEQVGAQPIVALPYDVTGSTGVVKRLLSGPRGLAMPWGRADGDGIKHAMALNATGEVHAGWTPAKRIVYLD